MIRRLLSSLTLVALSSLGGPGQALETHGVLSFEDLNGWAEDDHAAALKVFRETCADMKPVDWNSLCAISGMQASARIFFERFFVPVLVDDGAREEALFTAYFEPELSGSRYRGGRYRYPIYGLPETDDPGRTAPREAIERDGLLAGKGLEIAWVDDPVDVFFLQIQGSGRVRLDDGTMLRVGYGGMNGHEYRSVGEELVRRGTYDSHQVSADVIRNWVRRNGGEGRALLHHNPSYVFFREVTEVPAHRGPLGAMNRSITAGRSLAVDPDHVPLGAPVWIETTGEEPMHRLMIAQDTGSAIKGAQRGDIFIGTGSDAGRTAGRIKDGGRMVVLMPIDRAFALAEDL